MKATIFLIFVIVGAASALDCFVCNSHVDPSCKDPFSSNSTAMQEAFLQTCDVEVADDLFCRKTVTFFEVNGETRVHRDCATMRRENYDCYQKRAEDHVINVCQCDDDQCNSADHVASTSVVTAIITALSTLMLTRV